MTSTAHQTQPLAILVPSQEPTKETLARLPKEIPKGLPQLPARCHPHSKVPSSYRGAANRL